MSIEHMRRVFASDLPAHLRMVLIAIADSANDDGACWPGQMKLHAKVGTKERTVRDHLRTLESLGYLTVYQRGNKQTNWYQIHIDERGKPTESDRRSTADPDRRHTADRDRRSTADPPKGNPQIEPPGEPPTLAPAAPNADIQPSESWVSTARTFPVGAKGFTDDGTHPALTEEWEPTGRAHVWKRRPAAPESLPSRRDVLWEATCAVFEIVDPNSNERGKLNKAVALLRESKVDPSEIGTLHRVYRLKMPKAADTPMGLANNVSDCRRWANDVATVSPNGTRIQTQRRLQDEAKRRAIESGPESARR